MPNMTMTKTPMPEQKPDVRNHNFEEVALVTQRKWQWERLSAV